MNFSIMLHANNMRSLQEFKKKQRRDRRIFIISLRGTY
jgi:hypothetical protein